MKALLPLILLVLVLLLGLQAVFTVDEIEVAILTQFGQFVRSETEPGLKFKTPFTQTVQKFDKRLQRYTSRGGPQRYSANVGRARDGPKDRVVGPGTLVHIPRNTRHRSRPVNGPATFVTIKSPCGSGELDQDYRLRPEAKEIEKLYPGNK